MHKRVDAGTDVAMVGAWDAGKQELHLSSAEQKHIMATLENDASQGYLFLIHTGADGGGPIDIYVDTEVPLDALKRARPLSGEYLVAVPSGRLVVAGVEKYRAQRARITGDGDIVDVPPGDYLLRCHVGPDEDEVPASEDQLAQQIGADNLRSYDRITHVASYIGLSTLLLFPILTISLGWIIALVVTVIVFLGYWHLADFIVKRTVAHRQFSDIITRFRLGNQPPTFIFELRRVTDRTGLKGGSVRP